MACSAASLRPRPLAPTGLAFGPTISSVPEPSTLVLSSVGVLGLIGINLIRRRLPILEKVTTTLGGGEEFPSWADPRT